MTETRVFSLHLEQAKAEYAKLQYIRAIMLTDFMELSTSSGQCAAS
jgi:hypothetical protein